MAEATPGEEVASPTPVDAIHKTARGLLPALFHAAQILGISDASHRVSDRLPLEEGELPLEGLEEAASSLGLIIHIDALAAINAPRLTVPFLTRLVDGGYAVVEELGEENARLAIFAKGKKVLRDVPLATLARIGAPQVVFVSRVMRPDDAGPGHDATGAHWFKSAALRFKGAYAQVVIASFIVNILALASPLFMMNVYDRVIPNLTLPTLFALASGVFLALVFDFVFRLLRSAVIDEAGRRIDMGVSGRIYDHLLTMRGDQQGASTGTLASMIRDFDSVRDALTSASVVAMADSAFILLFLVVMYFLVGPLVIVPLLAALLVIAITFYLQRPLESDMKAQQADGARRHGILVETILALDVVRSIGGGAAMRRRFDRAVAESSRTATRTRFWSNLNTTLVQSISQFVSVFIIVWGVFLVLDGTVSVGALIAANILSGRVLAPLAAIAATLQRIQQARASYNAMDKLMALPAEGAKAEAVRTLEKPTLQFEKVGYRYGEMGQPALSDLSFSLHAGERLGVIGRVGCGKSTALKLINALMLPGEGRVLIDGVDVAQVPPAMLRRFVGYVGQEPELVSGALADVVRLGAPEAMTRDVERALDLSGLGEMVAQHPLGLSMPVVERGRNLSGGQRHALALAQVLVRRPKLLVLDEPTAALDPSAEARLLANLKRMSDEEGVTLVIATHRHSTFAVTEKLMVLEAGRLGAYGPRDKVLAALEQEARRRAEAAS